MPTLHKQLDLYSEEIVLIIHALIAFSPGEDRLELVRSTLLKHLKNLEDWQ